MKKCALKLAAFFAMVFLLLPVFKMEAAAWGEDAESITASGGRITVNWDGSRNCTEIEVVVDLNGSVIGRTGCDHGGSTSYTFFAKEYYELFPEGGTVTATISYLTYYSEKISRSNSYVSCTLPSLERAKAPEVSLSTDGLLTVTTNAEIDGFSYEVIKYDTQDKKEIALASQDISAPSAGTYQVDLREKMTSGYRYYVDVKGTDSTHKKGTSLKTRTNEVDCNSNFPHGKYNYNVWWVYDPEEKCLTFSGNGYSTLPGAYFGENYDCWKDIRHVVKTIVIEESVVEIEAQAFTDFTALQNLYIPFAMQKIEKEFITYRLDDWRQLVQVTYAGSSADWEHFGFDKVITATGFCKDSIQFTGYGSQCGDNVYWTYLKDEARNRGTVYIHGEGRMWDGLASNIKYYYADDINYSGIDLDVIVKNGVTYVGAYDMIIRAKDVHVTLASSVSELGESCFYATDTLRDVTFRGNLIKVIPEDCFADSGIRTLVLPQGIEEIGANAFNDSALEEITIPTSVKKIGFGAFYTSPSNKHLKAIYYKGGGTAWSQVEAEYMNNTDKLVIMGYSGDYGKVTFSNGGVAQDFVDYVAKGDTKEDPGEPWARNHMLEGWFADEALTQEFDFTTPIEDDTTVYAKWIERSEVENLLTEIPEKEVVEGATVSLIAPLRGGLFTYQWKKKEAGSTNYVDIEGANSKELTFTAALQDDGSKYVLFVYNKYGSSYSTGEVTLTVTEVPAVVITEQPEDITVEDGSIAVFAVKATGEGLTYQWQYKTATTDWAAVPGGGKLAAYSFTANMNQNGNLYRCVITDKDGKAYISAEALLTVKEGSFASPVISSLSNNATGVQVTWGAVTGASQYRVFYKTATGAWTTVRNVKGTSTTVAGLKSGTTYSFLVRCLSADGKFYTDTYDAAKSKSITYIAQPAVSSVSNTANGVQVKWNAVGGAAQYRVFYKAEGGAWTGFGNTKETSMVVTGLTAGTTYSFTVRCISADGKAYTSTYDTTGKSIVYQPADTMLAKPEITALNSNASGVQVTWGAVSGAAQYRVFYKTATGAWTTFANVKGTSTTVTGLTSGTTYTFLVRCLSEDGKAYTSDYDATKSKSITYIAQPAVSSLSNVANGVEVKWNAVGGAAQYRVFYKAAGGAWTGFNNTTGTSMVVTGLTAGTTYSFTVRCVSADGKSYTSTYDTTGKSIVYQPAAGTMLAKPEITALSSNSAGVQVTWGAVAGAAQYRVFYKTATGAWTTFGNTTGTSLTVTGLTSGTTYTFLVRCLSADGKAYTSDYDAAMSKSLTYIAQPAVSSVTNTSTGVQVKWNAVPGAAQYRVFYKPAGGAWTGYSNTTGTSMTVTGLTKGTTYSFTVRCLSADGKSYTSTYDTTGKSIKYE